jgi:chromosome segregation ATPase
MTSLHRFSIGQLLLGLCLLFAVALGPGCSSTDLSLLNEVKRFEPEWMDLSEQVAGIEELLQRTELRYQSFLAFAGPQLNDPEANQRYDISGARSQYRSIIAGRDQIEQDFETQKQAFIEAVSDFNRWQNQLMKDQLNEEEARAELEKYRTQHQKLAQSINQLEAKLLQNIEESNTMVRRVCNALGSARRDQYLVDTSQI